MLIDTESPATKDHPPYVAVHKAGWMAKESLVTIDGQVELLAEADEMEGLLEKASIE